MFRTGLIPALAAVLACPAFAAEPAPVVLGASPATVAGAPKTLADIARERKLNRTGAPKGSFSATESTAGHPDAPARAEADPAAVPVRGEMAPAADVSPTKAKVEQLRADLVAAQKELDRMSDQVTVYAGRPGMAHSILMGQRNSTLAPYRAKVDDLQSQIDQLQENCRKIAGCMPGWFR